MTPEARIADGLRQLGLEPPPGVVDRSIQYLSLIQRWNRVTNLTAVTEMDEMIARHLMDSLSIMPWLSGRDVIDVGSGAGLPGIPLALFNPAKDFILLDANGKKTRFMTQAAIELGLDNVRVEHARVEDFSESFDHLVSRAFRSLDEMMASCRHLLGPGGSVLAMKGPDAEREMSALDDRHWEASRHHLKIPGVTSEHCLVVIKAVEKSMQQAPP